jgi:hypothetical protein
VAALQDPFRAIVVDLLKDKQTFKRSEVTELANQQVGLPKSSQMILVS